MAKVKITDTILRDAHQSLAATRMTTAEMLPACELLDKVGYYSLEAWGGATFDSCLRFLKEDPWVRLRELKKALPNTKIQMLLRGQNLLGYKHYADDVVDKFVEFAIKNGVDIIRIFDALNDTRNMKTAMEATKRHGGICEAAISYTTSEVHTIDYFVKLAKELEKMGADQICIKDMANILLPYTCFELVSKLKKAVKIPIHLHTHNTAGTGDMIILKGIEAGADIVDTAISPFANGTSQPATEPLVASLAGSPYDTGIELSALSDVAEYFKSIKTRLIDDGYLDLSIMGVDINTLVYQVPGGMLSNLLSQLKQQNAEDKFLACLAEVPNVRKDFGYPPLVTPTSQIVGTQAVLNVLSGERYKTFTKESRGVLRGDYGKLPAEPDAEIVKLALGDEKRITTRPADSIAPEYEKYKQELIELGYYEQEEDVLSYALFPQVSINYFKERKTAKYGVSPSMEEGVQTV